jgi:diacylglycerol kinase family enzyme
LQLGIKGKPIAQASKIRITTECPMPMQIDGEPILLQASEILVEKKNQISMLVSRNF